MRHPMMSVLEQNPVLPAVKDTGRLEACLAQPAGVVFLLCGDILNIDRLIDRVHQAGKYAVVHADLVAGLAPREIAVDFLHRCGADGIISTRPMLLRRGRELGMLTVLRVFAIDSKAVSNLGRETEGGMPDVIEILPGTLCKVLRRLIESDRVNSMIFWGPPGVGKTTLAQIIARRTKAEFVNFSAVTSGVKEIKAVMQDAEARRFGENTIVFVDEIHRFNKAQQDAFLPFVEKGSIVLIGATTENPSFEINAALLSRCKVFVLKALTPEDLTGLLRRALTDPRGFGGKTIEMEPEALDLIANFANGDARTALNTLEMAVLNAEEVGGKLVVDRPLLEQCTSKKSLLYDKKGEEHYNLISALHKSMRNSDPDAAHPPTASLQEHCGCWGSKADPTSCPQDRCPACSRPVRRQPQQPYRQ